MKSEKYLISNFQDIQWFESKCTFISLLVSLITLLIVSDEETGLEIHKISRPPGFNMERRRSRAVLYQLSGHLQKQDKTKSKLKINNVRPYSSFYVINISLLRVILSRCYRDFSPKQAAVVHMCRYFLVWKMIIFPVDMEKESGVNFPLWYPFSFSFFSDWKWNFWIKWQPRCGSNEHLKYFVCLSGVLRCAEHILVLYEHFY